MLDSGYSCQVGIKESKLRLSPIQKGILPQTTYWSLVVLPAVNLPPIGSGQHVSNRARLLYHFMYGNGLGVPYLQAT